MPKDFDPEELYRKAVEAEQNRKDTALKVLENFISTYSPATGDDAETLLTTTEIQQAIKQHTGYFIESPDIFELMHNMGYSYKPINGMEFNWMLKKEQA